MDLELAIMRLSEVVGRPITRGHFQISDVDDENIEGRPYNEREAMRLACSLLIEAKNLHERIGRTIKEMQEVLEPVDASAIADGILHSPAE